jgi:hypothetical protein
MCSRKRGSSGARRVVGLFVIAFVRSTPVPVAERLRSNESHTPFDTAIVSDPDDGLTGENVSARTLLPAVPPQSPESRDGFDVRLNRWRSVFRG